jgi:ribosomal protein S18 acetylase RimI-like enzyme
MRWRQATFNDIEAIENIAGVIHPDLEESRGVFEEKLRLYAEGCFVLVENGQVVGYCLSHPWLAGSAPALGQLMLGLPPRPDCIFIHDVALLVQARGRGAAGDLLELLLSLARRENIHILALVSVYGTYPFWTRFGFEVATESSFAGKLKTYGDSARYMVRRLT